MTSGFRWSSFQGKSHPDATPLTKNRLTFTRFDGDWHVQYAMWWFDPMIR